LEKRRFPLARGPQAVLLAGREPFVGVWLPEELERYAGEVPWLKYVATVSRPWEDSDWKGETGRVDDLLRKYAHEWGLRAEETTGYLCGHPTMVENGRGILNRAGWKKDAVFEEIYFQQAKGGQPELTDSQNRAKPRQE